MWQAELPIDIEAALKWQAERTPAQVMAEREFIISGLEAEGLKMWNSGACTEWLNKASDASIAGVSATVNGPLLCDLCHATLYNDKESVQMFRKGADLYGRMCVTCIAPEKSGKDCDMTGPID